MTTLFSEEWMNGYQKAWNDDEGLTKDLEEIGFNSVIAYGVDGEDEPRGYISVKDGQAVEAGKFEGQDVNWDMRASKESWDKWMDKAPGMISLGAAYSMRKLKFPKGDYSAMIKNPKMAGPFIKTFNVMGKVQ
jgi:hypothetical protein